MMKRTESAVEDLSRINGIIYATVTKIAKKPNMPPVMAMKLGIAIVAIVSAKLAVYYKQGCQFHNSDLQRSLGYFGGGAVPHNPAILLRYWL